MNRFFVKKDDIAGNTARLYGDDVHHITKVLRMDEGENVILCDGNGTDYNATTERFEKDCVTFKIDGSAPSLSESRLKVTLFQGLPKAGKMELIIQKCVELGIYEIVPVCAARSVVKFSDEKDGQSKLIRYNRISYEAAKQSQRGIIPSVLPFTTFESADISRFDAVIVAYEEERHTTLKQALSSLNGISSIALIIGPEGGLEKSEVESLVRRKGIPVTLGKRILRTETASMAALAMLMYELDG